MLKIRIIALGKLKEKYLIDACEEYKKRLSAFCSLEVIELEPSRLSDNPTEGDIEAALKKEAEKIMIRIPDRAAVIPLCIEGNQMDSRELSQTIDLLPVKGYSDIVFVIGSSHGLHNSVKQGSYMRLSMSKMTFPHQLARVMLLEQLYRAFRIVHGGSYHK